MKEPSTEQRSAPRILVVLRPAMRRLSVVADLTLSGYEVSHVADGFDLLNHLSELCGPQPVDLLVLGADLPSLSGLAVLRTIRRSGCELPVLLVSDRLRPRIRRWLAPQFLLEPPFELWELVQRIEELVPPPSPPTLEALLAGDPPRSWSDLWLRLELELRADGVIHSG